MGATKFLVSTMLQKIVKRTIQLSIAWVAGHNLDRFGVSLDPVQASAATYLALEALRNWLKVKTGAKFL